MPLGSFTDKERRFIARYAKLDSSDLLIELEESIPPRTQLELLLFLPKVIAQLITGKNQHNTKRAEEYLTTLQRIFQESNKAQRDIALIQSLDSSSEEALLRIRNLILTRALFRTVQAQAPPLLTAIIIWRIGIRQFVEGSDWIAKKS